MPRKAVFYYNKKPITLDDAAGDGSRSRQENVDENFLRISKCLQEADIYVSTSKSYIDASKKSIDRLKESITHAEGDLNTAEECIMECEMRMQNLKGGLQALFNTSFYQNLDAVATENVRQTNETEATIQDLDNDAVPIHMSDALQKYAYETKINLNNFETAFIQYEGLRYIIMHPKDEENKPEDRINATTGGSNLQQNPSLDNLMLKNANDTYTRSGCRPKHSQSYDDFRIISDKRQGSHPCSQMYVKQNTSLPAEPSVRMMAFSRGLTKDMKDTSKANTFENVCRASGMPSGNVDIMQRVSLKQNTELDKVPNLTESLNCLSFITPHTVPQKSTSSEMKQTFRSSDVSLLRISESSEEQSTRRMSANSSQREGILVKLSSDSSDTGRQSKIQKTGRRRKTQNRPSNNTMHKQREDLIKMSSPNQSSKAFVQVLRTMQDLTSRINSDANQAVKSEVNTVGTSKAATNIPVSKFTGVSCPFNETFNTFHQRDFPETVPVNNLLQTVSCRPKMTCQSFGNRDSSSGNMWAFDDSSEADVSRRKQGHNIPSSNRQSLRDMNVIKPNLNRGNQKHSGGASEYITHRNVINELPFVNSTEMSDSSIANELLCYDTVSDYPHKKFRTPQYRSRCNSTNTELSLSFDSTLEMASFSDKQKRNTTLRGERGTRKVSEYFTCSSRGNSTSNDENTGTNSSAYSLIDDDKFFKTRRRDSSRNSSTSPSYTSLPDAIFMSKRSIDSYFENVSDSDVASSNTAEMSFNKRVRGANATMFETDDSFSSGNANASDSIYLNTSHTSFNSETPTMLNETFTGSLQNDLSHSTTETRNFNSSFHRRDSVDSLVTVYEAPTAARRQPVANLRCHNSAEMIEKSMLARISEEFESARGILPRIPVSDFRSRNAMFSYVPPARLNTSTPMPDSGASRP